MSTAKETEKQPKIRRQNSLTSTGVNERNNKIPYFEEIAQHLLLSDRAEQRTSLAEQVQITSQMKQILFNWLMKVAQKFKL